MSEITFEVTRVTTPAEALGEIVSLASGMLETIAKLSADLEAARATAASNYANANRMEIENKTLRAQLESKPAPMTEERAKEALNKSTRFACVNESLRNSNSGDEVFYGGEIWLDDALYSIEELEAVSLLARAKCAR